MRLQMLPAIETEVFKNFDTVVEAQVKRHIEEQEIKLHQAQAKVEQRFLQRNPEEQTTVASLFQLAQNDASNVERQNLDMLLAAAQAVSKHPVLAFLSHSPPTLPTRTCPLLQDCKS
jgi:hypothetical protein